MKQFRIWVVLLLSLIIFGCTTKFLYRNVDWIVMSYLDDYVSLTHEQERLAENSIKRLSQWHRDNELPVYVAHIDELMQKTMAEVTPSWVQSQAERLRSYSRRIGHKSGPQLYALLMQLNERQVNQLLENVAEKHQEFAHKFANTEESEIRELYQERMEKALNKWLGSLANEQHALMIEWSLAVEITAQDRIEQNQKMLLEFQTLFAKRDDPSYFQSTLSRLLNQPESFYTESLKQKMARNRPLTYRFIAQLAAQVTDKQYQHLQKELVYWRQIGIDLQ